jgi:hypothetical protein
MNGAGLLTGLKGRMPPEEQSVMPLKKWSAHRKTVIPSVREYGERSANRGRLGFVILVWRKR